MKVLKHFFQGPNFNFSPHSSFASTTALMPQFRCNCLLKNSLQSRIIWNANVCQRHSLKGIYLTATPNLLAWTWRCCFTMCLVVELYLIPLLKPSSVCKPVFLHACIKFLGSKFILSCFAEEKWQEYAAREWRNKTVGGTGKGFLV